MTMNKWIDCGELPFGAVSAKIEDDGVIISYNNTGDEADGLDEIREAVEAATGIWIETPSMNRWSAAEGDCEIVQTVSLFECQPTHEIVFTPKGGKPRVTRVCLFDGEVAYTRSELEAEASAEWEINDDGEWRCQGQVTPGGANGTVEIRAIRHDRLFQVTRRSDGEFFRFICADADEAFRLSQDAAGLTSWTRDSVTVDDIGGSDADHARIDASAEVRAVIDACCTKARAAAAERIRDSDPHDDAFDAGAHRKLGTMYGSVMRSLCIEDAMDSIPAATIEGSGVMFAMQRIYDAAWTAFGDEVDRLRAK